MVRRRINIINGGSSKGGEVLKDFVLKTWFKLPEEIKEQTKKHSKDFTGRCPLCSAKRPIELNISFW